MAGTINSLGLGSGILTSDMIDKLKANDTALTVTPISNKITLQQQKSSALNLLNSLLTSFKGSVSGLSDEMLYQKRTVSGANSAVTVTANAGVAVQSFSISNTQMALHDVKQSGQFLSADALVAPGGAGALSIAAGGSTFNINYTASMTLSELKDEINTQAGDRVKASVLQIGTGDYRLVLRSAETGADQAITLSDSGGFLDAALTTGVSSVQAAQDASFKYNGITLTRSKNIVTDVIPGVTISLLENNTTSTANISISQDVNAVSEQMSSLVQSYNSLYSQLNSMTTSNVDEGKVGIFNGDNSINSIGREITKMMTSVDRKGLSLAQFGIGILESGIMTFNSTEFNTKFKEDTTASEAFFSNASVDSTTEDGIFLKLNTMMERYTGGKGVMQNLQTASTEELKSLSENKKRTEALLTARYETMSARFAQYDSLISKLNNQFSSLQQQIEMSYNSSN